MLVEWVFGARSDKVRIYARQLGFLRAPIRTLTLAKMWDVPHF